VTVAQAAACAIISVGQALVISLCENRESETIWHLYFSVLCIIKQFVNTELPNENQNEQSLDQRFANRPRLRQRLLIIADMIDLAVAEGCTAHEAEARAIEQIRKLGNELLTDWAEKSEPEARLKAQQKNPDLINYGKKNS